MAVWALSCGQTTRDPGADSHSGSGGSHGGGAGGVQSALPNDGDVQHTLLHPLERDHALPRAALLGDVLAVAVTSPSRIRVGIGALEPDGAFGDFAFSDVAELDPEMTGVVPAIVPAQGGFGVFWSGYVHPDRVVHFAKIDVSGSLVVGPRQVAAESLGYAATSLGGQIALANVEENLEANLPEEMLRFYLVGQSSIPAVTDGPSCSRMSAPALVWSGDAFEVFVHCRAEQDAYGELLRQRFDSAGRLLGPPVVLGDAMVPDYSEPVFTPRAVLVGGQVVVLWDSREGWFLGTLDPGAPAFSSAAELGDFDQPVVAAARGGGELWVLERSSGLVTEGQYRGELRACPWSLSGVPTGSCWTFPFCDNFNLDAPAEGDLASNGQQTVLVYGAAATVWAAALRPGATPGYRPTTLLGRPRHVRPLRPHCPEPDECTVLVDEPQSELYVGDPEQANPDDWPSGGEWEPGVSSSLVLYRDLDRDSPRRVPLELSLLRKRFVVADRPTAAGIAVAAWSPSAGTAPRAQFFGWDGALVWEHTLPDVEPDLLLTEPDGFRLLELPDTEVEISRSAVGLPRTIWNEAELDSLRQDPNASLLAHCEGAYYLADGADVWRYEPGTMAGFELWRSGDRGGLQLFLGCGAGTVVKGENEPESLERWTIQGEPLPTVEPWTDESYWGWGSVQVAGNADVLVLVAPKDRMLDTEASLHIWQLAPGPITRFELLLPESARDPGLPETDLQGRRLAVSWCEGAGWVGDEDDGHCWLSRWELPRPE